MILESDLDEQSFISKALNTHDINYETTVMRAISSLGVNNVDMALVDADCNGLICDWQELTDFLKTVQVNYTVFSSNGKVGRRNGQTIVSIDDIANIVNDLAYDKVEAIVS